MKTVPLLLLLALTPLCAPAHCAPAKPKTAPKVAPPTWKPATLAQRAAAAASIRAQLDAFKRNDWTKAATYQSEGLRQQFGTVAQFRSVIERGYPQFAKSKSVAFDEARAVGNVVEIQVRLTGQDGVKLRAIYQMIKEKGLYRVAGVQGGAAAPTAPGDYV